MEEHRSPSIYTPLDHAKSQIRLVHLHPRSSSREITCSLHIASLDEWSCVYEALSYEWGPEKEQRCIKLNGQDFSIRENLWDALWHLRNVTETRIIWIDALAINQEDDIERGHQVQQMKRVYQKCFRVIAWIGLPNLAKSNKTDFEYVMESFELNTKHEECREAIRFIFSKWFRINLRSLWSKSWQYSSHRQAYIENFMQNSYWQRLWIIQEFSLAPTVSIRCGEFSLAWDKLEKFNESATKVYHNDKRVKDYVSLVQTRKRSRKWIFTNDQGLLRLTGDHVNSKCSQTHDHVFGLLGLSPLCCQNAVIVDYSKSIDDICEQVVKHHMTAHSRGSYPWSSVDFMKLLSPRISSFPLHQSLRLYRFQSPSYFIKINLFELGPSTKFVYYGCKSRSTSSGTHLQTSEDSKGEISGKSNIGDIACVLVHLGGQARRLGLILENTSTNFDDGSRELSVPNPRPFFITAHGWPEYVTRQILYTDFDTFCKIYNLCGLADELYQTLQHDNSGLQSYFAL